MPDFLDIVGAGGKPGDGNLTAGVCTVQSRNQCGAGGIGVNSKPPAAQVLAVLSGFRQADGSLFRTNTHPGDTAKISFEFRIGECLTRNRIVIIILPDIILRAMNTILPYTIRTCSQPTLAEHLSFRIIKANTHQVYHTGEVVGIIKSSHAIRMNCPLSFV